MKKIVIVFGTRPEAIKMAPVVNGLKKNKNFILKTVVTGQHRKMLDQALAFFNIKPDYDLNIMLSSQSLHMVISKCITGLRDIYEKEKPDIVLVHGDTTTTLGAALASYYSSIPVGHVEAGLRSLDVFNPFPEEQNRRLTDALCTYHFAPTLKNKENLLKENICKKNIFVTGNTVIDILLETARKKIKPENKILRNIVPSRKVVLVTAHRRENFGNPLKEICRGLKKLSEEFKDVDFIYPLHLNPNVKEPVEKLLKKSKNFMLIPPVSYPDMVWLMKRCYFCFTDSGGIQEEAPSLGKPVFVLRKVTERPEAVASGTVKVIGTDSNRIYKWGKKLLTDNKVYENFSKAVNPYGDGNASKRIINIIEYKFDFIKKKPREWKMQRFR